MNRYVLVEPSKIDGLCYSLLIFIVPLFRFVVSAMFFLSIETDSDFFYISKLELSAKNFNGFKLPNTFTKSPILDA